MQKSFAAVLRFYPVVLEKSERKKKEGEDGMDIGEEEAPTQIWILRLAKNRVGNQVRDALAAMMEDSTLHMLFEAELREDRAPVGSFAKPLMAIRQKD